MKWLYRFFCKNPEKLNQSDCDAQQYDHPERMKKFAKSFSANSKPNPSSRVFYEIMSRGLVWTDETDSKLIGKGIGVFQMLIAYRTSLMLNEPRDELKQYWEYAQNYFQTGSDFFLNVGNQQRSYLKSIVVATLSYVGA